MACERQSKHAELKAVAAAPCESSEAIRAILEVVIPESPPDITPLFLNSTPESFPISHFAFPQTTFRPPFCRFGHFHINDLSLQSWKHIRILGLSLLEKFLGLSDGVFRNERWKAATMEGHAFNGDGCHCSVAGIEELVPHVASLLTAFDADFLVTESCICAIESNGN